LSPRVARSAELRVRPASDGAPTGTTLPLRHHRAAALSLGPSFPVHALRWAAVEAPHDAHRRPLLRRRRPGDSRDRLPAVDDAVERDWSRLPVAATDRGS